MSVDDRSYGLGISVHAFQYGRSICYHEGLDFLRLQASGKKVFEPKEDDVARRKLNFDTSDGEGSVESTSVGSTSKGGTIA